MVYQHGGDERSVVIELNSPKKLNSFLHTHTLLIACPANECCWFFLPLSLIAALSPHPPSLSLQESTYSHCAFHSHVCVGLCHSVGGDTPGYDVQHEKVSHSVTHTRCLSSIIFYNHAARRHTLSHDCLCERNHFHLEQPVTFSPAGSLAQSAHSLLGSSFIFSFDCSVLEHFFEMSK